MQGKVWFITGCSSGLGRVLAEEVLADGGVVVATARKVETIRDLETKYAGRALALPLDVTKPEQIAAARDAALAKFGRVDVLETNVFGLLAVTRAFLPQLRKQRSGHILNLSSIAGIISTPGLGIYNMTKYAVEGVSEALAIELKPLGVKVTIVEPGPFRTEFLAGSAVFAKTDIADYAETAGKVKANLAGAAGSQKGDPVKGARAMMQAVESAEPPLRLLLGAAAHRRFQDKLAMLEKDFKAWEPVTLGTDYSE